MLVAIAIIALLIGILLPALGAARGSARGVKCLANLRSLAQGTFLYTNEHEWYFPFRLPPGETHTNSGRPRSRFHFPLGDYVGQPFHPRTAEEHQAFAEASSHLPRLDNPVFMCPLHDLRDFRNDDPEAQIQITRNGSYGYNYHYLGNTRDQGPDGEPANYPIRADSIFNPARTVALADSLGNQYRRRDRGGVRIHAYTMDPPRMDAEAHDATTFAQSDGKSPSDARHADRANVAWADGHADSRTLESLGYVGIDPDTNIVADDAGDNALWNGHGYDTRATNEAGEPVRPDLP